MIKNAPWKQNWSCRKTSTEIRNTTFPKSDKLQVCWPSRWCEPCLTAGVHQLIVDPAATTSLQSDMGQCAVDRTAARDPPTQQPALGRSQLTVQPLRNGPPSRWGENVAARRRRMPPVRRREKPGPSDPDLTEHMYLSMSYPNGTDMDIDTWRWQCIYLHIRHSAYRHLKMD